MSLDDWIGRIRSSDPMTFENAYFGARPVGPDVVPRIVAELQNSTDSYTRGKFCELLGEMGDLAVLPILVRELEHQDETVRTWAANAIEELQSPALQSSKQQHLIQFKVSNVK
ncbi:MAG: HEAT repeat domain-containing protein [Burkholderiaceae bacterium]|nr:HEAT repeat domain-containing protein [Burkholderiaceae bacterium]